MSNNNHVLLSLQYWYLSQCEEKWEKKYGISIDTLDNPGWMIEIDLFQTYLKNKKFEEIDIEKTPNNWLQCNVSNYKFQGFGGPENLKDIISIFNAWNAPPNFPLRSSDDTELLWLQKWYLSQCNGDWEHMFGISIKTTSRPGWAILINLAETNLEGFPFEEICEEQDKLNWYSCKVNQSNFEAECGPYNLNKILHIFREWVESYEEAD